MPKQSRQDVLRQIVCIAALCLLIPYGLLVTGLVHATSFPRERIELTIYPEVLEVNGLYVYANPWPIPMSQGLKTPFPVDALHPRPASVAVSEVRPDGEIPLRTIWFNDEPHFTVNIPARSEIKVRVRYRQLAKGSGTYILKTTQPWGRPLEHGEYLVETRGVRVTHSNYPLTGKGFTKDHFMPQMDWHLQWKRG